MEGLAAELNGEVVENEQGGRQSGTPYFPRGLPPLALLRISRILMQGAHKYEPDPEGDVTVRNWHKIPSGKHLNAMIIHLIAVLMEEGSDDHAGHMATRAMFYLHQRLKERGETP
jgi:hypothetical protein